MEELLPFLQKYELWIYVLLGVVAFIYLQRLVSAWKVWQGSAFGLEREIGQRRFSTALTIVLLLVVFILVEFVIVSFVAPSYPQVYALPTPTIDLLATPTVTLSVAAESITATVDPANLLQLGSAPAGQGAKTETTAGQGTGSPVPAGTDGTQTNAGATAGAAETTSTAATTSMPEGCTPGQIEWTFPKAGGEISATVELKGTVNIPNLGYYKYEWAKLGEDTWTPIAAGNQPKVDGQIGFWNTSAFEPGDYQLRLVVSDNAEKLFPACKIPVRIVKP